LQHAHNQGIVHRDIKPSNIMIDHDGRTMVMDFGIAKAMEGGTQAGATSGPIGTAEYMSPEQIMMKRITGATDQYSLGIVAYHLLTGRLPFQGTGNQVMMGHVNHPPEPVSKHRPDCPAFIERGILRMIAKDPADRFPSVVEAVRAIGGAGKPDEGPLDESLKAMAAGRGVPALSIPVREPSGAQPAPGPPIGGGRRVRAAVATAAVGAVALIGYLVFRPPPDPDDGRKQDSDTTRIDTTRGPGPGVVIGPDSLPVDSAGSRGTGSGGLNRAAVLQVSSSRIGLILGDSTRIPVVARDTAGQATPVQITVADPGIAQASWQRGQLVIRGLRAGTTTVRLAANGRTASVPVEVRPVEPDRVEVARLEVRPASATLAIGEGRQLVAESFDQQGRRLDAPVTWSSASEAVTVGPDGTIRARAAGSRIRITATAPGGKTATVLVDVPEAVRDTAATGGATTSGNSGGATSAEAEIDNRNRALVDLFSKRNTGALMGLYQAETGTDAGWGDRLATMVREDLESASLAGAQTEVQPNGAVSALQISVRYRDPVAGGRRSATLSVLVRYTRLGDQWTIRSFSLTRRPPA
ncbi:MAG: protein kinase, partial [Gemmatimonadales bacterium]|nr:protein kinase [Gemmatimonadales bacterium]